MEHNPSVTLPPLAKLVDSDRVKTLASYDSHREGTEYSHLTYTWDGMHVSFGDVANAMPGYHVPHRERRPVFNPHVCRMLSGRLTAFMLQGGFTLHVDGDPEASAFVADVAKEACFAAVLSQLRDVGGVCGTAVCSFDFVEGCVQFEVHEARHIHVTEWANRTTLRPRNVLKAYVYQEQQRKLVHAHLWTETSQILWDPIPWEVAQEADWWRQPSQEIRHDFGFCPVYIAQNLPKLGALDGAPDVEDLASVDAWTRNLSTLHSGIGRNLDPTLVVHIDPSTIGPGQTVRKGSDNAIFSEKGAKYLELEGGAARSGLDVARYELEIIAELAGVVLADGQSAKASARSAAALKMLYAPMIAQCDKLRVQYGERLAVPLMRGVLHAARRTGSSMGGEVVQAADGRLFQVRPGLTQLGSDNQPLKAGTGSQVRITWGPYFDPTQQDIAEAVKVANDARGKLISHDTASKYVAQFFGVEDTDEERAQIAREEEEMALRMAPELPDLTEKTSDDELEDEESDKE